MKIGIDARLIHETGVGRYIRNLIRELASVDTQNTYVVFLLQKHYDEFVLPNSRWQKKVANVRWHSISEQLLMPFIFLKERLDLVHIPYFNAPIFYPGKYVITIHDLIILHFDTGNASTLPYVLYKIRRIGYRIILRLGVTRASHIMTVSDTVKRDIMSQFGIHSDRITRAYEGVDPVFLDTKLVEKTHKQDLPFFLYVGNVYPHKNIDVLLRAYAIYKSSTKTPAKLVLVGPSDYFYGALEKTIKQSHEEKHIIIKHDVTDIELQSLYAHAEALVFPSKMEGFGLPALEAIAHGCRVIASNIPVFREIFGDHAVYVDPGNPSHFAFTMKMLSEKPYDRSSYRKAISSYIEKFSWRTMAMATYDVYKNIGAMR